MTQPCPIYLRARGCRHTCEALTLWAFPILRIVGSVNGQCFMGLHAS